MKKILKVLSIIALLCTNTIMVYALPTTYERETLENYGVKKDWKINESNKQNVLNTPAVDASEKLYDFSDVLTDEDEQTIKERINEFIEKTKMDMVIVLDKISYPDKVKNSCYNEDTADQYEDEINETYGSDFYDYNDFGMEFENNSGVLLLRNTEKDPCWDAMYYDMYTFGNTQLYFNQYRYDDILDGIFNNLKSENYVAGFIDFIDRTERYILSGKPNDMNNYYVDEFGYLQQYPPVYTIPWAGSAAVAGIITLIVMIILIKRNKMVMKATQATEYLNKGSVNISNRKDVFIHSHTSSYTVSSDSGGGGGGGGHSSHSGSSGGGHSSGGGRHG